MRGKGGQSEAHIHREEMSSHVSVVTVVGQSLLSTENKVEEKQYPGQVHGLWWRRHIECSQLESNTKSVTPVYTFMVYTLPIGSY